MPYTYATVAVCLLSQCPLFIVSQGSYCFHQQHCNHPVSLGEYIRPSMIVPISGCPRILRTLVIVLFSRSYVTPAHFAEPQCVQRRFDATLSNIFEQHPVLFLWSVTIELRLL